MEYALSYIIYFTIVFLGNIIDYRMYKTLINPFFFISIPFTIIMLICVMFNGILDFVPFYPLSLNIWSAGLLLFWIGGHVCQYLIYIYQKINHYSHFSFKLERRTEKSLFESVRCLKFFNILFVGCILFSILLIMKTNPGESYGSKEMGEAMGQGGIAGRVANLLILAVPFYMCATIHWKKKLIAVTLLLVAIMGLGSKTWLTYSLLAGLLILGLKGIKINFKAILLVVVILFGSFVAYYKLNTDIEESSHFYKFILRHFYFYLTSGILPMSEVVRADVLLHPGGIHHPFVNLIKYWIDPNSVHMHSTLWITTDNILGTQSNVFTFFGTLYFSGINGDFIIYSILCGLFSYLCFFAFLRKKSIFVAIPYAYTLAVLFFGWYNLGFSFMRLWEIYVYSFIFYYIAKYRIIVFSKSKVKKLKESSIS